MSGHAWYYFVPYQPDLSQVLLELKQREFAAGRYNPAQDFPFPPDPGAPPPGAQHASIEDAIEAAFTDGTRSILDMDRVAGESEEADGVVSPAPARALLELFGTTQPTRDMVEDGLDIMQGVGRGRGIYVVIYRDGKPSEIFFGGFSYD